MVQSLVNTDGRPVPSHTVVIAITAMCALGELSQYLAAVSARTLLLNSLLRETYYQSTLWNLYTGLTEGLPNAAVAIAASYVVWANHSFFRELLVAAVFIIGLYLGLFLEAVAPMVLFEYPSWLPEDDEMRLMAFHFPATMLVLHGANRYAMVSVAAKNAGQCGHGRPRRSIAAALIVVTWVCVYLAIPQDLHEIRYMSADFSAAYARYFHGDVVVDILLGVLREHLAVLTTSCTLGIIASVAAVGYSRRRKAIVFYGLSCAIAAITLSTVVELKLAALASRTGSRELVLTENLSAIGKLATERAAMLFAVAVLMLCFLSFLRRCGWELRVRQE